MARIRTIKPEFWEDDRVGQLSPWARLVFIGSWNLADDAGRLRWSPDYINAALFMYDRHTTTKVRAFMAEVEDQGLVVPYTGRGQDLAFVPGFGTHQRISKPQPPRFPEPPDSRNDSGNGSGNETDDEEGNRSALEGKGKEGKGKDVGGVPPPDPPDFVAFWNEYPNRSGKGTARKAWPKALKAARGDAEAIIAGAKRFAADPNREDAYTPHPATWLNAERWDDPPLPAKVDRNGHVRVPVNPDLPGWQR